MSIIFRWLFCVKLLLIVISNALYSEDSVESFPRQDKSDDVTYSASPKIDYSSQYELKLEGDVEETDPDIIPFHYGMENYLYMSYT